MAAHLLKFALPTSALRSVPSSVPIKILLYPEVPDIIALITNEKSQPEFSSKIPVLDLDDTKQVAQFILNFIGKSND